MKTSLVSGLLHGTVLGLLMVGAGAQGGQAPPGPNSTAAGGGCAVLPQLLVEQIIGVKFHEIEASKSMPAHDGAWGSSCGYSRMEPFPQGQDTLVDLMIFTESSASVAKATFDKAAAFMVDSSKPKPAIGDEAYWGQANSDEPTIHVLKGRTHFQLSMMAPADEKKVESLAAALAGRL